MTGTGERRYRGASGEQRRDERRRKLLEAAIAEFGTRGYHATTVRAICGTAGLTERYFYESWSSREELLAGVFALLVQRLHADVTVAVAAAPREPAAMAQAALDAFFRRVEADPAAARVQFFEILGVSTRIDALYRQAMHDFGMLLVGLVRHRPGGDALHDIDEDMLAAALIGAVVLMGHRWVLSGYALPRARVVHSAQRLFAAVMQPRATSAR